MRIETDQLRILSLESLRDAARRRIVPAVLVMCFLTLFMLNSCTSCSGDLRVERNVASLEILGWGGLAAFTSLALWMVALSGLLAADHLSSALDDGTAQLIFDGFNTDGLNCGLSTTASFTSLTKCFSQSFIQERHR